MKTLYYNGKIITMENNLICDSLLADNYIIAVGSYDDLIKQVDENTKLFDLEGKTLLPGFIDAHSHIVNFSKTLNLTDLSDVLSVEEMIIKLKQSKEKFIIGFGYDHNSFEPQQHPTNTDLNKVSTEIPVMISHKSGHMGVLNDAAMKLLNVENKHNGYFEEQEFFKLTSNISSDVDIKQNLLKSYDIYSSYGITTVQEGYCKEEDFNLLLDVTKERPLPLDTVCYVDVNSNIIKDNSKYLHYIDNLKLGGYKTFLDGSPQSLTAWMKHNYNNQNHSGYQSMKVDELDKILKNVDQQILIHSNGSKACEVAIDALKRNHVEKRPVLIHSQFLDINDIPKLKGTNIIPSLFVSHVYYYGDIHLQNVGPSARHISPAKTLLDNNIIFTFHQDTPVFKPNMLELVHHAVNRMTCNGKCFDEEKIPVYDALKAITINAAYQYFEENLKGSLRKGKLSDFVILDKNPLEVETSKIKDIKVLYTIKDNNIIYKNSLVLHKK